MKIYRIYNHRIDRYLGAGLVPRERGGKVWVGLGPLKNAIRNQFPVNDDYYVKTRNIRKEYEKWRKDHTIFEYDLDSLTPQNIEPFPE